MNNINENLKKITRQTLEISNIYMEKIGLNTSFTQKLYNIINPIIEANRIWSQNLIARNPFKELNIDFSKIEEKTRKGCEKMIAKGFYPYKKIGTSTCISIIDLEDDIKIENILGSEVEYNIINDKKNILENFKDYENIIKEIYELYDKKKYRLCILSLINLLSQIFNNHFENKDFTETDDFVLKDYRIMNITNEEYYQFMPYCKIYNNENKRIKKYYNALLANYKNNCNKYNNIPYNRNAILHGYSNNFGNKINCLRWFSVLLNTNDILESNKL